MLSVFLISLFVTPLSANTIWDEMFVRYGDEQGPVINLNGPYGMSDGNRTFLHIRRGSGEGLRPVYFFAHGNDGKANLNYKEIEKITSTGYAVISWESVTSINKEPGDVAVCQSDHKRVMEWSVANAANYSLDTSKFVIGGRSRGSLCSWPVAQGHDESYSVSGLYMYNALPSDAIFDETLPSNVLSNITNESPPFFFAYGPWCPRPITQNCTCLPLIVNPDNTTRENIHSPRHGQKIVEAYQTVGLWPWTNLTDGMNFQDISNIFHYFPYFVTTLPNATSCAAGMAATCDDYQAGSPQECAQCVRTNVQQNGATLIYDDLCDRSTIIDLCMAAGASGAAMGSAQDQYATTASMKAFIFEDAPVAALVAAPVASSPGAAPSSAPAPTVEQAGAAARDLPELAVVVGLLQYMWYMHA